MTLPTPFTAFAIGTRVRHKVATHLTGRVAGYGTCSYGAEAAGPMQLVYIVQVDEPQELKLPNAMYGSITMITMNQGWVEKEK